MFYTKIYDSQNYEYEELRVGYKDLIEAQNRAKQMSKQKRVDYAVVEDEDFNRFGWFENGEKIYD